MSSTKPALISSRVTRGEAIARGLEREVTGGNLRPGERLGTRQDLRLRFGVALGTINEAVRLLEMRGMLTVRSGPRGGVFVANAAARVRLNQFVMGYRWGEAAVADHHAVRNALEPPLCRAAARAHRGADIRALERVLDAMEREVASPLPYLRQTWALHRRIAAMCPNTALRSIYLTLLDFLEDSVEGAEFDAFDALEHLGRHRELVAAIDEGPGERLEAAVRAHEVRVFYDA
jgi:DNA-binding FadR family transcriptional regulator